MIIGISGKIGSGKDEVGRIIQKISTSSWKIKKFADALKDIVCILIGCTREQLEDRKFKETELGEEWNLYSVIAPRYKDKKLITVKTFTDINNANNFLDQNIYPGLNFELSLNWASDQEQYEPYIKEYKLTPRKLLQLLGTEAGREIIHPNIWINALFSKYILEPNPKNRDYLSINGVLEDVGMSINKLDFPNWIITDVRFPNEADAILEKGGIMIRIDRFCYDSLEDFLVCHPDKNISLKATKIVGKEHLNNKEFFEELKTIPESKNYIPLKEQHESETALDSYTKFNYMIYNNSSLEELEEKVKLILISEKLL